MSQLGKPIMGTNPSTWKWTQIAQVGTFKGHGSGEFELTPEIFGQIVTNFHDRGLPVAWDLEHASEQDASSGSIPVNGAPAVGWIHNLDNRGDAGLWALVEWGPKAKDYIRNGEYRYCSPALRFNSKDPRSGRPVGVRLTSVAMTNSPFLDRLQPLAAKDALSAAQEQTMPTALTFTGGPKAILQCGDGQKALAHKPHEYMPQLQACLGLHQLSTSQDCLDHLDKLRDRVDECGDAMGTHQGVDLSQFSAPLRDLVGADKGDTWEEVFDAVESLIQAAMDEHMVEEHGAAATDKTMTTAQQAAVVPAVTPGDTSTNAGGAAPQAQTTTTEQATMAEKNVTELETQVAELTLSAREAASQVTAKDAALAAKDAEIATLKADADKRADEARTARIDEAFDTYKDAKKLTDADREAMAIVLGSKPETFEKLYPRVTADKRHLLTQVATGAGTGREPRGGGAVTGTGTVKGPSLSEVARQLSDKHGIPLEEGMHRALAAARRARNAA
jgi:hypothetical protein